MTLKCYVIFSAKNAENSSSDPIFSSIKRIDDQEKLKNSRRTSFSLRTVICYKVENHIIMQIISIKQR